MKLYSFVNHLYLSPIQYGIQTQHVATDMELKYHDEQKSAEYRNYHEWAKNHKTTIILQGGTSVTLAEIYTVLSFYGNALGYPVEKFHEDAGLNFALTSVAIVVPEDEPHDHFARQTHANLREFLSTYRLA